jgi:hypothetical protein
MYVHIFISTHIYLQVGHKLQGLSSRRYVSLSLSLSLSIFYLLPTYLYVCMYACIHICIYMYVYLSSICYLSIYMYVYIYVHIVMSTYIYLQVGHMLTGVKHSTPRWRKCYDSVPSTRPATLSALDLLANSVFGLTLLVYEAFSY